MSHCTVSFLVKSNKCTAPLLARARLASGGELKLPHDAWKGEKIGAADRLARERIAAS